MADTTNKRAVFAKPEVIIRPVEAEDKTIWTEMWHDYNTFYDASVPAAVTAVTWTRILDQASPVKSLLATNAEGDVLGFANYILHPYTWSDKLACLLDDLFVRPEARNQGVGRALIEHLVVLAQELGCGRLYWMTREGNSSARRLYDHFCKNDDFVRYSISFDDAHEIETSPEHDYTYE